VLQRASDAKGEQARQAAVHELITEAGGHIAKGNFDAAIAALHLGSADNPGESKLSALLAQALQGKEEANRRRTVQAALERALELQTGDPVKAMQALDEALRIIPDYPGLLEAKEGLQARIEKQDSLDRLLTQARQLRDRHSFEQALQALTEAEKIHPESPECALLRRDIEVNRLAGGVSALRTEGLFSEAILQLDKALEEYPGSERLLELRRQIRADVEAEERRAAASAIATEANRLIDRGDLKDASDLLEAALRDYPDAVEFPTLSAYVNEAILARERNDEIARLSREARSLVNSGKWTDAIELLERAWRQFPEEEGIRSLLEKARTDKASADRARAAERVLWEAEGHRSQGRYGEAIQLLDDFLRKHGDDAAVLAARQEMQAARAAEADRTAAETRQMEHAITQIIAGAEAAISKREFQEAFRIVDSGLSAHPGEERLLGVKGRIGEQQRKENIAWLTRMVEEAKRAVDPAALDEISARALSLANGYANDGEIKTAQIKVQSEVQSRTAALAAGAKSSQQLPAQELHPSRSSLPIYVGIVVGIAAFGVVYLLAGRQKAPSNISVQVRVTPAGAEVRAGDQTCRQEDCKFVLLPGQYEVSAKLPGYEPASRTVTIENTNLNLNLALSPLPAKLQISTNLETGTVTLDGKPAGQLQGGTFRADNVAQGTHSLKISGPDGGEASFQFETKPGQLPKLIGQIDAKQLEALVVTNLDSKAELIAADASKPVTVAGRSVPANGTGVRQVDSLGAGAHEIKVGGTDGPVYVLNTASAPALTVFLHANRDTGTLLVETRQDGAAVFIDNRRYSRATEQGVISIPLPARTYSIRVEKPGFDSPPAQHVQIAKSRVNRLGFILVPKRGTLVISGALPGTSVKLDGAFLAVVQDNGSFPVPAGEHTVEFAKDRYVTKQVRFTVAPGARVELARSQVTLTEAAAPPPAEQKKVEASKQMTVPADARDWEPLKNSRDVAALEAFRRKHPSGPFSEQALLRLEEIRKQQDDIVRRQREQAEAVAKLKEAEKANAAEAEKKKKSQEIQAIRGVIEQYAKAFESKSLGELIAVWPGMPAQTQNTLKRTFRDAKSISLKLNPESIEVAGNSATVVCDRQLRQVLDRPLNQSDKVTINLKRNDKGWVIAAIL
jgi:tetratricopeptide (TPR) repeat protein